MSRNAKIVIGFILIMAALIGGGVFYLMGNSVKMNPDNTTGNTAGNLNNYGYFCENNGKVFFSNSQSSHCLYSMNVDESNVKQLTSLNTKYINAGGKYIYFYMDSSASQQSSGLGHFVNEYGIYRAKENGKNMNCLVRDFTVSMQLCGSYLYYQSKEPNRGSLYKIRIDKTKQSKVTEEMINPACYVNGLLYYNGVNKEQNLHTMDTLHGDSVSTLANGYYYDPVVQGNYLYYMDVTGNYRLCRMDLRDGTSQVITQDRIDFFNLNDTYIYYAYSSQEHPALKMMKLDGSDNRVIIDGIYNSINLTSKYVYFMKYGDDVTTYHMPLDGSSAPTQFNPQIK
ncbi:MAG: DUF5050 domain-containing protein [Butyrivibrio sp.]|jgi:hypothetical protein|nr:DUF5050 domain-containing protein [Butyrivibrio sp.]